jgi:hypothetical protein
VTGEPPTGGRRGLGSELHECLRWLGSPTAYANLQVALQTRCGVLRGPFAGMRYPLDFVPRQLFPGPYQAGSFECELDLIIGEIVASEPEVLVNVGSAQGYYAIGLGRAVWKMSVIAYEADPAMRAAARRIALLNEVEPRLDSRGLCTISELAGLGPRLEDRSVCLLMDCEGGESVLVDPDQVEWLAAALILVELHPESHGELAADLAGRLAATHRTTLIRGEPRWASRFPELWWVRGLRDIDRELIVAEYRQGIQEWLWAVPKEGGAGPAGR